MSKARPKEQPVPQQQLGWTRKEENDDWGAAPAPSKTEVACAHFNNRQLNKDTRPLMASWRLRLCKQWDSCLKKVQPGKTNENMRDFIEPFTTRSLLLRSGIRGRFNGVVNRREFNELSHALMSDVFLTNPQPWMIDAVLYPLGPHIILHFDAELDLEGLRYQYITFNNQFASFLAVEVKVSTEETLRIIEKQFAHNNNDVKEDDILITEPNTGYGVQLRYGKEPTFIVDAKKSRLALIFDDLYSSKCGQSAMKFYSDLLQTRILTARLLNDPEKRWVEYRIKNFTLRPKAIRLIEFECPEERNKALALGEVKAIDVMFCESMFDYLEHHQTMHLGIHYDTRPRNFEGVTVTLLNEYDKAFAEKCLGAHGLSVYYLNNFYKHDLLKKYDVKVKTLNVLDFPRHHYNFKSRRWLVERILKTNNIKYTDMEKLLLRNESAYKNLKIARTRDLKHIVDYELYRIGHINNIYHPVPGPWFEQSYGEFGARCFWDVVSENGDVPWKTSRKNEGALEDRESFTVHFINVETGLALTAPLLRETHTRLRLRYDPGDSIGPRLHPTLRRSIAITRAVRVAIDRKFKNLDLEVRMTLPTLSKNEDPIVETDEATYYNMRLYEEWQNGGNAGIIGIMGWNPQLLRFYFIKLEKLVTPKIFNAKEECPQLLFGIGETYVNSLKQKYDGALMLEVDKFNEHIKLLGDATEEAYRDLQNYSKNRHCISIHVAIPMCFPFINDRIKHILNDNALGEIRRTLGIRYLLFDHKRYSILFEGTIEAYELLMGLLNNLSSAIFKVEMRGRKTGIPDIDCPTCWTEVGANSDYYRFYCGHVMCRQCTNAKIKNISSIDVKIKCEEEGCDAFIAPSQILNIILGGANRLREFDTSKLKFLVTQAKLAVLNSSIGIINCTSVNCPGLLSKSEGDLKETKKCESCAREYCRNCLAEPHKGQTCEQFGKLRLPDDSIRAYIQAVGADKVKKCPHCQMFVEKKEGCNHIQCACGTHFCFLCLFTHENSGGIYEHMNVAHGGHGGEMVNPEQLDDADPEMQQMIEDMIEDPPARNDLPADMYPGEEQPQNDPRPLRRQIMFQPEAAPAAPAPREPPEHTEVPQFQRVARHASILQPVIQPPFIYRRLPKIVLDSMAHKKDEPDENNYIYVDYLNDAVNLEDQESRIRVLIENNERDRRQIEEGQAGPSTSNSH